MRRRFWKRQRRAHDWRVLTQTYGGEGAIAQESDLGLVEGAVGNSRLPLVLRKLEEEESGMQEPLSLKETVNKAKAAEYGFINEEYSIPNGLKAKA